MLIFALSGCATIVNPYEEDFTCPETLGGKCTSMSEAYDESISDIPARDMSKQTVDSGPAPVDMYTSNEEYVYEPIESTKQKQKETPEETGSERSFLEQSYQKEVFKKLTKLLEEPETPLVKPAKVMRVLIFPYRGNDKTLHMMKFSYMIMEEPMFVIGDYLFMEED